MNNDRFEALDGYRVITPGGKLIGEVARVSETAIIVHLRRLGRSIYRPLPSPFGGMDKELREVPEYRDDFLGLGSRPQAEPLVAPWTSQTVILS